MQMTEERLNLLETPRPNLERCSAAARDPVIDDTQQYAAICVRCEPARGSPPAPANHLLPVWIYARRADLTRQKEHVV
jgi:hypothetical protein